MEFIKLTDYNIAPCRACLGCLETNKCLIKDDGVMLAEKAKEAEALVIAGFTPYSTIDSRTKAFLERLYPLRHKHGFMAGKPGAAVVTSAVPENNQMLPPACEMGVDAIKFYMMEEGMNFVGAVKILGNIPCVKCGHGDDCKMSGIKMIYGSDASVDLVGIKIFEKQSISLESAQELGKKIAEALGIKN
jgi:multimeric flavodoxin WrbA